MSRNARFAAAAAAASFVGALLLARGPLGPLARAAPPGGGEPFVYAAARASGEAPPARFAAPLPRVAEFGRLGAARFPPASHVRDLLCAGDEGMWRRAREAIAASPGATLRDVARTYGELLRFCGGDGCFAAKHLRDVPATVALPAWLALSRCPRPEADALFRRPDAPPAALLARAEAAEWGRVPPPDPERVADAALAVVTSSDGLERRLAAFRLAEAGGKGARALLALHAKERDPARRHDLAMALSEVDDPRARAAWRAACARREDPVCSRDEAPTAPAPRAAPEPPRPPPPAALVSRLRALGLLPDAELPPADVAGVDRADTLLVAAGRAHAFDVETGMFPNEHDALLRELAALAGGALGGALFAEVPPEDDERRPYVLQAWAFGQRWEVDAENLGDWYDVGACVGLLNAIARARGLEVRWMVLATGDQMAIVAAGPEAGLRAAVGEGLLHPAAASAAMETGKAFERRVLDLLRANER